MSACQTGPPGKLRLPGAQGMIVGQSAAAAPPCKKARTHAAESAVHSLAHKLADGLSGDLLVVTGACLQSVWSVWDAAQQRASAGTRQAGASGLHAAASGRGPAGAALKVLFSCLVSTRSRLASQPVRPLWDRTAIAEERRSEGIPIQVDGKPGVHRAAWASSREPRLI